MDARPGFGFFDDASRRSRVPAPGVRAGPRRGRSAGMTALVLGRLWQAALVLAATSVAVYALIGLMPGDPIDLMLSSDPDLTAEDALRLKALHDLDRPVLDRWWTWARRAAGGDLGYSRLYAAPVLDVLGPALANTLVLLGTSFLLALSIALPAGALAAVRPFSWYDRLINFAALAGVSAPVFWLGLVLIVVFAVGLGVLPAGGTGDVGAGRGGFGRLHFLVLPVATLVFASVGGHLRFMRAAVIEALGQHHIRTARAKGAGTGRVVVGHALRNAMIPVTTVIALDMGTLVSGALVVETVFAWPGTGKLIYDAIMGNDFNLALAALLTATGVTLLASLLADLAYGWLDPRVTYR